MEKREGAENIKRRDEQMRVDRKFKMLLDAFRLERIVQEKRVLSIRQVTAELAESFTVTDLINGTNNKSK